MHIIFKCQTVSFSLLSTGFVGQQGPSLWVIVMAVACIIALVLPLEGVEYSGSLPHYLLLSVNQKLLAAFILGRHDCFVLLFYFNFLTQRSQNFVFSRYYNRKTLLEGPFYHSVVNFFAILFHIY